MPANTTYFWKVVPTGGVTGPTWSFTTLAGAPGNTAPANGATGVATNAALTWTAPAGGAASYDVYFGTANPPPLAQAAVAATTYSPAGMTANTTYFWKVVPTGGVTGPTWSFTTLAGAPANTAPADGATGVATNTALTWTVPTGGAASYDVYFGSANPPPKVQTALAALSYSPAGMTPNTTYFWKVVPTAAVTEPTWPFTTLPAPPPGPPHRGAAPVTFSHPPPPPPPPRCSPPSPPLPTPRPVCPPIPPISGRSSPQEASQDPPGPSPRSPAHRSTPLQLMAPPASPPTPRSPGPPPPAGRPVTRSISAPPTRPRWRKLRSPPPPTPLPS